MITTERADFLISHVVDGEATAEHWRELEGLAAQEPKLWRELAESQRDAAALRSAIRGAGDAAERIALPTEAAGQSSDAHHETALHAFTHPHLKFNRFGAWTGWLAAAVITIIATVQFSQKNDIVDGAKAGPGETIAQTAGQLFDQYLTTGQKDGSVLGEVPGKMLVESRPAPSGQGFEIIFVRQVVERAIVPDLYKIDGTDDRGQATLARYRQPVRRTM